jgi:hypothetical protein
MKRTGRPPLVANDVSVTVTVTLPSKQLETYIDRARRDECSVPEIIRRDLSEKKTKKS